MNLLLTLLAGVLAYLLGSVPSAVWIGKRFHNIDVRDHGSGNAGTTNVIRVLGWKAGIPVLIVDIIKGWLAAMLPVFFHLADHGSSLLINMQIVMGVIAIIGHIFPVFAGFRGGKGVATIFGVLLAVHLLLTLCAMGVFLFVLLITGIVSISSMIAGLSFPIILFLFFETPSLIFKVFAVIVSIGLIATHRKNIRRLLKGEEKKLFHLKNKINFGNLSKRG